MLEKVKAFARWFFAGPSQLADVPSPIAPLPTPPPRKPPARSPRVYCPVCGRDVAITGNGITFEHRTRPGTLDKTAHRVRIIDGVEV